MFRRSFLVFIFLALFTLAGVAQEGPARIKVAVGYSGTEFKFDPNEVAEYLSGLWLDVDGRIAAHGGFRLGGVVNFQQINHVTQVDPMAYPKMMGGFDVVKRDTRTLSFGPRLSYKAGPIEPFGAALFGFRSPTDVQDRKFSRRYQLGVDVDLGHFFVRPFYLEYEFTNGFVGASTHRYGAGGGFKF